MADDALDGAVTRSQVDACIKVMAAIAWLPRTLLSRENLISVIHELGTAHDGAHQARREPSVASKEDGDGRVPGGIGGNLDREAIPQPFLAIVGVGKHELVCRHLNGAGQPQSIAA